MKYNDNGIWKDLTVKVSDTLPIGTVIPFAGNTVPSDWMVCDGSTLSRTEYALLFAAIGTSFGEGDGETTFNIPDLRGKAPVGLDLEDTDFDTIGETGGEKEHTLTINELPSHSHRQLYASNPTSGSWGRDISGVNYHVISSPVNFYNGIFSGETGENQAHNIMQPYVVVNYIIKVLDASALGSGLIVDGASTSNTDAYSCNYVNGLVDDAISRGKGTILYNNSTGSTTSVTLSQSLADFDEIAILFACNVTAYASSIGNKWETVKFPDGSGKTSKYSFSTTFYSESGGTPKMYGWTTVYTLASNSITLSQNHAGVVTPSTMYWGTDDCYKIVKVVGYKYN